MLFFPGKTVGEVCRKVEITDQAYDHWPMEYGGLKVDQAKRHQDTEAVSGNFCARRNVLKLLMVCVTVLEGVESQRDEPVAIGPHHW